MQRFLPRKLDYRGTKQNPSLSNMGEGFINWGYFVVAGEVNRGAQGMPVQT